MTSVNPALKFQAGPSRISPRLDQANSTEPHRLPSHPHPSRRTISPTRSFNPSSNLDRRRTHRSADSMSEDPELPRPPQPPSPAPPEANAPPPAEEVTPTRLAAHYSGLVLASMVGTLIRLGLEALATYDGMVIFPLAWAQGVGCGIMGLSLARQNEIVAIYPPLYTFLTTGIAGSITTFSSWMLEGYLAFSDYNGYNRNGLHDTVDGLAYSFSTFAISLDCVHLGSHVSSLAPPLPTPTTRARTRSPSLSEPKSPPQEPSVHLTPLLDIITILTAVLSYLIALLLYFLAPTSWRHRATFPILLGPPGAILRFFLSRLNTRSAFIDRFPIGTFISNVIATLLISGVFAAQRRPSAKGSAVTCNALNAIQQGFCGCLSTVSTFAVEASAIKRVWWKWVYIGGSVVLGHVLVLAIVGGVGWREGYSAVCTG